MVSIEEAACREPSLVCSNLKNLWLHAAELAGCTEVKTPKKGGDVPDFLGHRGTSFCQTLALNLPSKKPMSLDSDIS